MDEHFKLAYLFDIYAPLLTPRQQQAMNMFYNNDLTVSEIAEQLEISRQAVSDLLRRTNRVLLGYDEKLNLFAKYMKNVTLLNELISALSEAGALRPEIEERLSALSDNL